MVKYWRMGENKYTHSLNLVKIFYNRIQHLGTTF